MTPSPEEELAKRLSQRMCPYPVMEPLFIRDCNASGECTCNEADVVLAASALDAMMKALEEIATQKTTEELLSLGLIEEGADFEGAYDTIIGIAREAYNAAFSAEPPEERETLTEIHHIATCESLSLDGYKNAMARIRALAKPPSGE